MREAEQSKANWKQRARHELFEYWVTACYLTLYFGAFMIQRRLLLAEYHIHYAHYGLAVIEALVLAKIILIGDWFGVGKMRENRPLIHITLYRSTRFTCWVILFKILESMLEGLIHGRGLAGGLQELLRLGKYELLADALIIFFTFIPFFAFRELNRVLGQGMIWNLFFRKYESWQAMGSKPRTEPGTVAGTTDYDL